VDKHGTQTKDDTKASIASLPETAPTPTDIINAIVNLALLVVFMVCLFIYTVRGNGARAVNGLIISLSVYVAYTIFCSVLYVMKRPAAKKHIVGTARLVQRLCVLVVVTAFDVVFASGSTAVAVFIYVLGLGVGAGTLWFFARQSKMSMLEFMGAGALARKK